MKKLFLLLLIPFMLLGQTKVSTLSGTTNPNFYFLNNYYNDGPGNESVYNMPYGVAVDPSGVVYAFDTNCPVIRKILPNGFTSLFAGKKVFSGIDWQRGFVDGSSPEFSNITAITTDLQGNVIVADNNRIRIITQSGVCRTLNQDNTHFKDPLGLVTDSQGTIYVADSGNKRIRKVDSKTGAITTLFTGLTAPTSICIDNLGNFVVADGGAIKHFLPSGSQSVLASGLNNVSQLCYDSVKNEICFTRNFENQIYKINSSRTVSLVAGTGQGGFRDTSTLFFWRLPLFQNPNGICVDKFGNLYVADTWNQRIRKISN